MLADRISVEDYAERLADAWAANRLLEQREEVGRRRES